MFRKYLLLSLVLTLILGLVACSPREVTFPDANLEAAIREAIGKPEGSILPSDSEKLTSLDGSGNNITDITGLEYCSSLSYLSLRENQISDISPLVSLSDLAELNLELSPIGDISPLASLTNLTSLDLRNTD